MQVSITRKKIIWEAMGWKGTRYLWGGNSRKGIDCSHFVWQIYHKIVDRAIPEHFFTSSANDSLFFKRVESQDVIKGDLIVWGNQHIGIVVEPGSGTFIGAQCSTGVAGAFFKKGYWAKEHYFLQYDRHYI
ncbi:MAG: NlpC/P60 family protein [Pyrinomonadaceae bacterium]